MMGPTKSHLSCSLTPLHKPVAALEGPELTRDRSEERTGIVTCQLSSNCDTLLNTLLFSVIIILNISFLKLNLGNFALFWQLDPMLTGLIQNEKLL